MPKVPSGPPRKPPGISVGRGGPAHDTRTVWAEHSGSHGIIDQKPLLPPRFDDWLKFYSKADSVAEEVAPTGSHLAKRRKGRWPSHQMRRAHNKAKEPAHRNFYPVGRPTSVNLFYNITGCAHAPIGGPKHVEGLPIEFAKVKGTTTGTTHMSASSQSKGKGASNTKSSTRRGQISEIHIDTGVTDIDTSYGKSVIAEHATTAAAITRNTRLLKVATMSNNLRCSTALRPQIRCASVSSTTDNAPEELWRLLQLKYDDSPLLE